MSLNFYCEEEANNREESANKYKNLFTDFEKNPPSFSESLTQMYTSSGLNNNKVKDLTADILNQCKQRIDSNFEKIRKKYANITKEDAYIICSYTCESKEMGYSPYRILNQNLVLDDRRNGVRNISKYLYLILKALRKLPRYYPKNKHLYRCLTVKVKLNQDPNNKNFIPYTGGNIKTFWGFTSTTTDAVTSYSFLKGTEKAKTGTIFVIGGDIWGYDIEVFNYFHEKEILLEPERKVKIDNALPPVNGIIYINCSILKSNLILTNEKITEPKIQVPTKIPEPKKKEPPKPPEKEKKTPTILAQPPLPKGPYPIKTILHPTGDDFDFLMGDYNHDGYLDLFCIKKRNTGSKCLEVHILSGKSNYQEWLLQTKTPHPEVDEKTTFLLGDYNLNGKLDLYCIQKRGHPSGKIYLNILKGSSEFKEWIMNVGTCFDSVDDSVDFAIGDFVGDRRPDLYCIKKTQKNYPKVGVVIIKAKDNYQSLLMDTGTILDKSIGDDFFGLTDYVGHGKRDLYVIKRSPKWIGFNVVDGTPEKLFQTYLMETGFPFSADKNCIFIVAGQKVLVVKKNGNDCTEVHLL